MIPNQSNDSKDSALQTVYDRMIREGQTIYNNPDGVKTFHESTLRCLLRDIGYYPYVIPGEMKKVVIDRCENELKNRSNTPGSTESIARKIAYNPDIVYAFTPDQIQEFLKNFRARDWSSLFNPKFCQTVINICNARMRVNKHVNETKFENGIDVNDKGAKQTRLEVRFDLVPADAITEIANVLYKGANKYGVDNWKGIPTNEHVNHAIYHLYQYMITKDKNHLKNASCRSMFALQLELEKK